MNPERANIIRRLFEVDFYVLCNYFFKNEELTEGKSKHGIITLVPKKLFKAKQKVVKPGMISKSEITLSKNPNFSFTLISYYNPSTKDNPTLFADTTKKYSKCKNVIYAGDFNQIIDLKEDYNRINGTITENTKK